VDSLGRVLRSCGRYDEARTQLRRSLSLGEKVLGADHPYIATILYDIGRVEMSSHQPRQALPPLERALPIRERQSKVEELAQTRFLFACALWDAGRDHERSRRLADQARAGYVTLGPEKKAELAEIDEWMASHR
jgi:eukaryotic-like serine/threonine-protein kinase